MVPYLFCLCCTHVEKIITLNKTIGIKNHLNTVNSEKIQVVVNVVNKIRSRMSFCEILFIILTVCSVSKKPLNPEFFFKLKGLHLDFF